MTDKAGRSEYEIFAAMGAFDERPGTAASAHDAAALAAARAEGYAAGRAQLLQDIHQRERALRSEARSLSHQADAEQAAEPWPPQPLAQKQSFATRNRAIEAGMYADHIRLLLRACNATQPEVTP